MAILIHLGQKYGVEKGLWPLVDVANASVLRFLTLFGVPLQDCPNVAAWLQRCSSGPALSRVK